MAVRYEGGEHSITGASEPDLELTDDENLIRHPIPVRMKSEALWEDCLYC